MQYIGVDMSKDTFHVCFDDEKVKIFRNTKEGISTFVSELSTSGAQSETTIIGVEATGVYHLLFAQRVSQEGWKLMIINPLITSRMMKTNLRQVKTDKSDAVSIRKCLLTGVGYLYTETPEVLALKALVQEREALIGMRSMCKQRQHAHTYKQNASGFALLENFTAPVETFTAQIRRIEKEFKKYAKPTQKLLGSIPGIGKVASATLVAYVGDIHRFSTPEKLTAYIGLDCRVHQSGTSIHGKGFITKRGNKYMRSLLFNAAFVARQHNLTLKEYFEKKRKEGKHYFSAMCAVERKLIHLIYAVWKRGTPFEHR